MITIPLPYGRSNLNLHLEENQQFDIILPQKTESQMEGNQLVSDSIVNPLNNDIWAGIDPNGRVSIAINDKTRPVPNDILIPPILKRLTSIGFSPDQIEFLIATGTHKPMRNEEFHKILPSEITESFKIFSHDCDDRQNLQFLGETSRKTPIWINKKFMEADLKIVIGNIEPHHFMGFSGGVKTAAIGLAGRETININHAMLVNPLATFGTYHENPTRSDIEEIGDLIHIDIALNVVMNESRKIIHSFLGAPKDVMQAGIPASQRICQTEVDRSDYDIVIASPGGYPKDINLYQAQKAISHAASITKDGGTVILIAACKEGIGNDQYVHFMEGISSPEEVFTKIGKEGFSIGPHKALQFAREQKRIQIYVVSSISPSDLKHLLLNPAESPDAALKDALPHYPTQPWIAIMPKATNTIPKINPYAFK